MKIKQFGSLLLGCLLLWQSSVMAQGFAISTAQTGMQVPSVQENIIREQNKISLPQNRGFTSTPDIRQPRPVVKPAISVPSVPQLVVQQPVPTVKKTLSSPSISSPVSGTAMMAPKATVSSSPTMPAHPTQPKSRGFVPAVQAPALSVKPLSPVAPVSSSVKTLVKPDSTVQTVAPGIMSQPVTVMQNPVAPGPLNLKGKRDADIGTGFAKAEDTIKKTKAEVMKMDPLILIFTPSPAEKGPDNQYLTSESAAYQLKYQVRDADEIRIRFNNTSVFHKKGLNPDKTVSGSVPVDAMKNRYGQAKRKPGLEEFTLEVMRHNGFTVKKITRKIRVLYSKAHLVDPEIKKFQIEKIKVKRVEQGKGRVFDRRIVTLKLVFKNAVKVKLEQRTDDNPTFTAIALEKMWQNLSPDSGREHVLYKTVNLPLYDPENRNRKVYFKATIEGQFGNKDTELLLVDTEGKRVKQGKQLDWKGVRFVDIKNNTDWYASRAFWVTMQYRYIRQLELYFSDDKNCTITVYKRKFKQARSSMKTEAGLTIPPHKLLSCLESATEPGKAVRQKLYGYLYVKYEDDTGTQVTRMYPKPVTIGYNSTNDDVLFHNVLVTNVLEVSPPMPETIQIIKSADNPKATPVLLGQDIRLKYKGYGVDWLEAVLVTEDGQQEKWFSVTGQGKSNEVNINKTKTLHKFYTGLLVRYEGLQRGGAETRLVQKFFSFKTHKPVSLEVNVKLVNEISFYKNSSYQLVYLCKALDSTNLAVANAYGISFLKTIKKGDSRLEKIKVDLDIAGLSLDVKNAVIKCEVHVSGVLNKLSKTVTSTKIIPLSELEKSRYIRMPSVKLPVTGKQ